jgi:hypothetical protein
MKKQTVYKVVKWDSSRVIYSSHQHTYNPGLALTYVLDARTTAPRGTLGVFVFLSLPDARHFARAYSGVIFKSDGFGEPIAISQLPSDQSIRINRHYRRQGMRSWLAGKYIEVPFGSFFEAPKGTYTVSSIIPRRVVL